jgi:hypothetical protein
MARSNVLVQNDKLRIKKVFKKLEKEHGYFARTAYEDCQSCSLALIPKDKEDKYVYFHFQDEDSGFDHFGHLTDYGIHLGWNGDAALIRREFEAAGFKVEHDGSEARRILIKRKE